MKLSLSQREPSPLTQERTLLCPSPLCYNISLRGDSALAQNEKSKRGNFKMKKRLGNLLLFITSLMCVMVLFGCVSINSKAARKVQQVKDFKIVKENYHFKTVTDGYYHMFIYHVTEKGKRERMASIDLGFIKMNENVDMSLPAMFIDYDQLGKITFYLVGRDELSQGQSGIIDTYENNPNYVVSSWQTSLAKRMPRPTGVKAKPIEKYGRKWLRITWDNDECGHVIEYYNGNCTCSTTLFKSTKYTDIEGSASKIKLRTITTDLNQYANSESTEAVLVDEDSSENPSEPGQENPANPDNGASSNDKKRDDGTGPKIYPVITVQNVTIDSISYQIHLLQGDAYVTRIGAKKKVSLNKITVDGKTYYVSGIMDNACRNNKKIRSVTIGPSVDYIGKKAFYNCRNLGKVTIKANEHLTIRELAFKKIKKGASIKIKGVKGRTKKELFKAIK